MFEDWNPTTCANNDYEEIGLYDTNAFSQPGVPIDRVRVWNTTGTGGLHDAWEGIGLDPAKTGDEYELIFNTPGIYGVDEIQRSGADDVFFVWYKAASDSDGLDPYEDKGFGPHPGPANGGTDGKRTNITLSFYELALVAENNDGRHTKWLDISHNAFSNPIDVRNVNEIVAQVNDAYGRFGHPLAVVLVPSSTIGDTGFIVGSSFFFAGSAATVTFGNGCRGQISSLLVMVSNSGHKVDLYQDLATRLGGGATVRGYTGRVAVVDGNPGYFTILQGSELVQRP
jgi:hypothetical protein